MTISLKILIPKGIEKIIKLDEPIKLCNCSDMFGKSISIFWNYNNLYKIFIIIFMTQMEQIKKLISKMVIILLIF